MKRQRYQQRWVKGEPVPGGYQRECEPRYEAIRKVIEKFDRPISIFDLGANMGYFSFRLAEDFPQHLCVAVDDNHDLPLLAERNGLSNVVVLPVRLSQTKIKRLAWCESFDVVLALNVIHHLDHWDQTIDALLRLGDVLIVETPGAYDFNAARPELHNQIRDRLLARKAKIIARHKSHVSDAERLTYLIDQLPRARMLQRQSLDSFERGSEELNGCKIKSSWTDKTIRIKRYRGEPEDRDESRPFMAGMNLWNYHLLDGRWPDREVLCDELVRATFAAGIWHDDIRPWNFIMTAAGLQPIDAGNKPEREPDVAEEWGRYDLTEVQAILRGQKQYGWKVDEK